MATRKYTSRFIFIIRTIAIFTITACSNGEPEHSKAFLFEGGRHKIEITVTKDCTYEVGISFSSKDGQSIKQVFGNAREINLAALIDISLSNEAGVVEFTRTEFGGHISEFRYGPNPLKMIAGKVYLDEGKYLVELNIKEVDNNFSGLISSVFVAADPKVTCRSKKQ